MTCIRPIATLTVLLTLAAVTASAQLRSPSRDWHIRHEHAGAASWATGLQTMFGQSAVPDGRCGTFIMNDGRHREALANTARSNPQFYRELVERAKRPAAPRTLSAPDDFFTFAVRNGQTFDPVTAKLVFFGRRARIWVDVRDTTFVRKNTIAVMARALDTATAAASRNPNKGIIENDEEVFGQPPINKFDPATPMVEDFLLTDIKTEISGGNILGFFSPLDQTEEPGSNRMNILYIDTKPGLGNQSASALNGVLSTIAHEYQHLIHFRHSPEADLLYNEGCSEVASTLNGYFDRPNTAFLSNTNLAFFRWSRDDGNQVEIDYQRGLTFVRYLFEQYGESFLTKLVASTSSDIDRLSDALVGVGRPSEWQSTFKGFWTANYVVRNYSDPRYVWKRALSNSAAKITNNNANVVPPSGEAVVQQFAAIYNLYSFTTPAGISIRFQASGPYTVMAILYRGTTVEEVREFPANTQITLGNDVGYAKIVFVVINLSYNAQTIRWTAQALTSDVDDAEGSRIALQGVSPNPAAGPMTVRYRTNGHEPVTLEAYDMRGALVRRFVDAERLAPGDHSALFDPAGLPSGVYTIRMRQGAATTAMRAIVTH